MIGKDFTPTKETISLHGLGFIQLVLKGGQRLHVWHPELPKRKCFAHSNIHNHRFSFESTVLKGVQNNDRYLIEMAKEGFHELISHNGPRSKNGGRISHVVGECIPHFVGTEKIPPGNSYTIDEYEYHSTSNKGIVITLMKKLSEGYIHANSVCKKGVEFDYDFNRFQLSPDALYDYVIDALKS